MLKNHIFQADFHAHTHTHTHKNMHETFPQTWVSLCMCSVRYKWVDAYKYSEKSEHMWNVNACVCANNWLKFHLSHWKRVVEKLEQHLHLHLFHRLSFSSKLLHRYAHIYIINTNFLTRHIEWEKYATVKWKS